MPDPAIDSIAVTKDTLVPETKKLWERKARFAIATCNDLGDKFEIIYHFDDELKVVNLRLQFGLDETAPSIAPVYPAAALIEMEMAELFGVKIEGAKGNFLLTDESPKTPMRKKKKEAA